MSAGLNASTSLNNSTRDAFTIAVPGVLVVTPGTYSLLDRLASLLPSDHNRPVLGAGGRGASSRIDKVVSLDLTRAQIFVEGDGMHSREGIGQVRFGRSRTRQCSPSSVQFITPIVQILLIVAT